MKIPDGTFESITHEGNTRISLEQIVYENEKDEIAFSMRLQKATM